MHHKVVLAIRIYHFATDIPVCAFPTAWLLLDTVRWHDRRRVSRCGRGETLKKIRVDGRVNGTTRMHLAGNIIAP